MSSPGKLSRYRFCTAVKEVDGRVILTDPEPYGYRDLDDNVVVTAKSGDNWWSLAAAHYSSMDRPADLWWAIFDFQPDEPHDPTLTIEPGKTIYIPSLNTVLTRILNESRRIEFK